MKSEIVLDVQVLIKEQLQNCILIFMPVFFFASWELYGKLFFQITAFPVMIRYIYNLVPKHQVETAHKVKTEKSDALK